MPSRPGAMPQHPRFVRHEFLMAVMPHDKQPRVAVATTPKEVASSGFVHEKGFPQPRHDGSPPNLPRDTMLSPTWSAWPPGLRCSSPAESIPKPRDSNISLRISGLSILESRGFRDYSRGSHGLKPSSPPSVQSCIVHRESRQKAVSRHNDQAALPRMAITPVRWRYKRKTKESNHAICPTSSLHGPFLLSSPSPCHIRHGELASEPTAYYSPTESAPSPAWSAAWRDFVKKNLVKCQKIINRGGFIYF